MPHSAAALAEALGLAVSARESLADLAVTLLLHDDRTGEDTPAPLAAGTWQALTGKPEVKMYPVPNPDGSPGLFAALCWIAPGSSGRDGSTPISQLIAIKAGELECNGRRYGPGQTLYIPPNQPSDWRVGEKGYLSAILFNGPPPDCDDDDGQPSCCSITPDLPPKP